MYECVDKSIVVLDDDRGNIAGPVQRSKGVHHQKLIIGPRIETNETQTFLPNNRYASYAFGLDQEILFSKHPHLNVQRCKSSFLEKSASGEDNVDGETSAEMEHQSVKNNPNSPSDEFSADNDDLFQHASNPSSCSLSSYFSSATLVDPSSSTPIDCLPSARTLRGGQAVVALSRHISLERAMMSSSTSEDRWDAGRTSYSTQSSLEGRRNRDSFEGGPTLPLSSRLSSQKLTLGLKVNGGRKIGGSLRLADIT